MIAGQTKDYTLQDLLDYNAGRPSFLYVMIKAAKLTYAKAMIVIDNIDIRQYNDDQLRIPVMKHIHAFKLINNFTDVPYRIPQEHRNFMAALQIQEDHVNVNESDNTRIMRILNREPSADSESLIINNVVDRFIMTGVNCDAFIHNLVRTAAKRIHGLTKKYYLHDLWVYASDHVRGSEYIPVYLYIIIKAMRITFGDAKKIIDVARVRGNFNFIDADLRTPVMKWIRSKGLQNNFTKEKYKSVDLVKLLEYHENITFDMSDFDRIGSLLSDFTIDEISTMESIQQFVSDRRVYPEPDIFKMVYTREHLILRLERRFPPNLNAGYSLFLYFIHRVCQECDYGFEDAIVFASKFKICFDIETYVTDRLDNEREIRAYIKDPNISTPFIDGLKVFYDGTIRGHVNEEVATDAITILDKWMGYRINEE